MKFKLVIPELRFKSGQLGFQPSRWYGMAYFVYARGLKYCVFYPIPINYLVRGRRWLKENVSSPIKRLLTWRMS